jgi:hypothetical protein
MATVKELICLANSRKHSGRCVAGIEVAGDGSARWIRPVSDREGREVSASERRCQDGSDPRVLDVISVPVLRPSPDRFHTEDWLLDARPGRSWERIGRVGWRDLVTLEQSFDSLWINELSTYHGLNNRMSAEQADSQEDSLRLIRVDGLTLRVHAPGAAFDSPERVVDARFQYAGSRYAFRVTDPLYRAGYLAKPDGVYELGESFLTVSLSELYEGYSYKLVAAVIERAKVEVGGRR